MMFGNSAEAFKACYSSKRSPYVDGESSLRDIKFATKSNSQNSAKQRFQDTLTATDAISDLPLKVKQSFGDVTFEFGNDGSSCDIASRTIKVGIGTSKEEIFHEYGHLIERYMMKQTDVQRYKKYLVNGLRVSDIIIKTYYDSVGNDVEIFLLKGNRFDESAVRRLTSRERFYCRHTAFLVPAGGYHGLYLEMHSS